MTKTCIGSAATEAFPVLWDSKVVADYLGLSMGWLERDRASDGPKIPYIKVGRAVRYRATDVVQALEKLSVGIAK